MTVNTLSYPCPYCNEREIRPGHGSCVYPACRDREAAAVSLQGMKDNPIRWLQSEAGVPVRWAVASQEVDPLRVCKPGLATSISIDGKMAPALAARLICDMVPIMLSDSSMPNVGVMPGKCKVRWQGAPDLLVSVTNLPQEHTCLLSAISKLTSPDILVIEHYGFVLAQCQRPDTHADITKNLMVAAIHERWIHGKRTIITGGFGHVPVIPDHEWHHYLDECEVTADGDAIQ